MRGVDKALISQGSSVINFVRTLGGATGVSLCGIMLEWRLTAHGDSLTTAATSAARLDAFDDVFIMLAVVCSLAIVAAWQLRVPAPGEPSGPSEPSPPSSPSARSQNGVAR